MREGPQCPRKRVTGPGEVGKGSAGMGGRLPPPLPLYPPSSREGDFRVFEGEGRGGGRGSEGGSEGGFEGVQEEEGGWERGFEG